MKRIIIVFSLFIFYTEAMENDVENKKYDSLKALSAMNISGNDLYVAVKNGEEKIIQKFLEAGGDPNEKFITSSHNSLLHFSALFNHEKILELLLSVGARVNVKNWCGETPLHRAIGSENKNMIIMLHRAGARFNIKEIWENTPSDIAGFINPEIEQLVASLEKEIPSLRLLCMKIVIKNKLVVNQLPIKFQRAIDCIREDES